MSFSSLKKNRSKQFEKLNSELTKLSSNPFSEPDDDEYWAPTVDKAGNGYAVIRFLPAPEGEDMPFVRIWDHFFKGPTGRVYAEKSLSTLNLPDPLYELNGALYNSKDEEKIKQAKKQGRNLRFVSNIYIIEDTGNPEMVGKVKKYKYGKRIFDKLNNAMSPEFPDEKPMNPFDLWEGANFKLKARNVEGYRNYDKSEFADPAPLFDDDEKMEAVYNKEYSLKALLDPSKFKSYEDLKKKLDEVLGNPKSTSANQVQEKEEAPKEEKVHRAVKAEPEKAPEEDPVDDPEDEEYDFSKFMGDD